jgi:uncharacterized protein (DUF58 family)
VKRELARLNHVLIPATKSERDRYRNGRVGRRLRVLIRLFTRLTREGRFFFAVAVLGVAFSLDVGRTEAHLLVFGIASLLLASLLVTPAYRLAGVTANVRTPRRVTVGEEIEVTLTLRNDGERAQRAMRVERPLLPWDGTWAGEAPTLGELPPGASLTAVMQARFIARGEHDVDPLRVAALVPLWLAQGRPIRTEGARFVVVPKVARVVSVTTRLTRRNQPGGVASASGTGDTSDLLGVRPYRAGDPVRDLHARSWARHGEPMVREYQEEHLSRVAVVLDDDVRAAGTLGAERLEAALSLAAGVVARIARGDALVDLLVVGDDPQELATERGPGALDQALDLLAAVQPGAAFSAPRTFARLAPYLERLSSVVFVALAWDAARAGLAASIRARGLDCTVLVVGARDAREPLARTVAADAITRGEALAL